MDVVCWLLGSTVSGLFESCTDLLIVEALWEMSFLKLISYTLICVQAQFSPGHNLYFY